MNKLKSLFLICSLPLLLTNCRKNQCDIQTVNGIQIYSNKNISSNNDFEIEFTPKKSLTLSEVGVNKLYGIVADKDNNLYILDGGSNSVTKVDIGGNKISTFMQRGSGPGEVVDCGAIVISGDTVMINDYMSGKLIKYDTQGKFLIEKNYNNLRRIMDFSSLENGGFVGFRTKYKPTKEFMNITKELEFYNNNFELAKSVFSYQYKTDINDEADYTYTPNYTVDNQQKQIFISSNSETDYLIDLYSFDGKQISKIKKSWLPVSYTEAEKEKFLKEAQEYNPNQKFPYRYKQVIKSIFTDNSGLLWVQTANSVSKDSSLSFDIFKDGVFQKTVNTPLKAIDDCFIFIKNQIVYQVDPSNGVVEIYEYMVKYE